VLLRPSTWAPSVCLSGQCCQVRPVVTRVTTGRTAGVPRAPPLASDECQFHARRIRRPTARGVGVRCYAAAPRERRCQSRQRQVLLRHQRKPSDDPLVAASPPPTSAPQPAGRRPRVEHRHHHLDGLQDDLALGRVEPVPELQSPELGNAEEFRGNLFSRGRCWFHGPYRPRL